MSSHQYEFGSNPPQAIASVSVISPCLTKCRRISPTPHEENNSHRFASGS